MYQPIVVSVSEMSLVFYYGTCNFFFKKDGTYTCDNPVYQGPSKWTIHEGKLYFSHMTMMNEWAGWDNKIVDQSGMYACVALINAWIHDDFEKIIFEQPE